MPEKDSAFPTLSYGFFLPWLMLGSLFWLTLFSCSPENPGSSNMSDSADQNIHLELPDPEKIAALPPDGGPEFNRLIFESSPYLLQHARNPIDWRAWGKEALQLAIVQNKPIFLSIGYTTCHWCHVMERESFEDMEVARLLNQDYICIKVDREERPDLDHVYMSVTQMMTGRGGWPMTVILTPEKIPFFAGTYFPKSSMLELLPHFARVWADEREKVNEIGRAIIDNLHKAQASQAGGDLNATHLDKCYEALAIAYDPIHGGFGQQPKFPTPHVLSFLLRYYHRSGNEKALDMVIHTLRKIRLSGTYDQVGWGIHRYSTDREWLVPHFEKMLYDQALFSIACLETYQITHDPFFKNTCEEILAYVDRELSDPLGGFYSAEDADSEGEEGKFYLWTTDELVEVLGKKDAEFFSQIFRFETHGNYLDEASGKRTGSNIPHLAQPIPQSLQILGEEVDDANFRVEKIRNLLFQAREQRVHPQLDDKVLTDWNGLMISAFARAAGALDSEKFLNRARKAADFCLQELRQKNGRLYKRWRQGKSGLPAHLEDYAFLTQGLLDIYEASLEPSYLLSAQELMDHTRRFFEDTNSGGFFLTAVDGEKLLTRPKEIYDGAIPSGNSIMAMNLARLWKITGDEKYLKCLQACFTAFSGFLNSNPSGAENFLHALAFVLQPPSEMIVTGELKDSSVQSILKEINKRFLPFKTLIHLPPGFEKSQIVEILPYSTAFTPATKPTFFLCRDHACEHPRIKLMEIIESLEHLAPKNQK